MEGSDAAAAPQPLRMDIRPAGVKGMGAFAAEPATTGAWVCTYEGELLTLDQVLARYDDEDPAYLFSLGDGASLYLDGARGSHPSRYINHHQNGSLVPRVSLQDQRVDFFAARDLAPGDELTFDCAHAQPQPRLR
jgi:SET domain-containing protein